MNRAQLMAVKKQRRDEVEYIGGEGDIKVQAVKTLNCSKRPVDMTLKDQKDLSTEAQAIKSYSECW